MERWWKYGGKVVEYGGIWWKGGGKQVEQVEKGEIMKKKHKEVTLGMSMSQEPELSLELGLGTEERPDKPDDDEMASIKQQIRWWLKARTTYSLRNKKIVKKVGNINPDDRIRTLDSYEYIKSRVPNKYRDSKPFMEEEDV